MYRAGPRAQVSEEQSCWRVYDGPVASKSLEGRLRGKEEALAARRDLKKALETTGFSTSLLFSSTKHVHAQVEPLACSEWH